MVCVCIFIYIYNIFYIRSLHISDQNDNLGAQLVCGLVAAEYSGRQGGCQRVIYV